MDRSLNIYTFLASIEDRDFMAILFLRKRKQKGTQAFMQSPRYIFFSRFLKNFGFCKQMFINFPVSNFTEIRPAQAAPLPADRWTDGHDEAYRRF